MADYTIERGLGVRERMDLLAPVHEPATVAVAWTWWVLRRALVALIWDVAAGTSLWVGVTGRAVWSCHGD